MAEWNEPHHNRERRKPAEEEQRTSRRMIPTQPDAPGALDSPQIPGMTPYHSTLPGHGGWPVPPADDLNRPLAELGTAQRIAGIYEADTDGVWKPESFNSRPAPIEELRKANPALLTPERPAPGYETRRALAQAEARAALAASARLASLGAGAETPNAVPAAPAGANAPVETPPSSRDIAAIPTAATPLAAASAGSEAASTGSFATGDGGAILPLISAADREGSVSGLGATSEAVAMAARAIGGAHDPGESQTGAERTMPEPVAPQPGSIAATGGEAPASERPAEPLLRAPGGEEAQRGGSLDIAEGINRTQGPDATPPARDVAPEGGPIGRAPGSSPLPDAMAAADPETGAGSESATAAVSDANPAAGVEAGSRDVSKSDAEVGNQTRTGAGLARDVAAGRTTDAASTSPVADQGSRSAAAGGAESPTDRDATTGPGETVGASERGEPANRFGAGTPATAPTTATSTPHEAAPVRRDGAAAGEVSRDPERPDPDNRLGVAARPPAASDPPAAGSGAGAGTGEDVAVEESGTLPSATNRPLEDTASTAGSAADQQLQAGYEPEQAAVKDETSGEERAAVDRGAEITGEQLPSGGTEPARQGITRERGIAREQATGEQPVPEGAVRGNQQRECPPGYPVKGNQSGLYHLPESQYYEMTVAEFCFRNAAAAEAAGFSPPRHR